MAEIRPFRGLRVLHREGGRIEELTCPPYDIISEEQRQAYLKENEHNVIRLSCPGENPFTRRRAKPCAPGNRRAS